MQFQPPNLLEIKRKGVQKIDGCKTLEKRRKKSGCKEAGRGGGEGCPEIRAAKRLWRGSG